MTKYKEYMQKMLESNKALFKNFKQIHDFYGMEQDKWQEEFNKEGEKVMKVIQEWENKLCLQSEKGGYSKFTGGLSEKFRAEIKKVFPMLDYIGIIVKKKPTVPDFTIKKIKLS